MLEKVVQIEYVLHQEKMQGYISDEEFSVIKSKIVEVINHPKLKEYHTKDSKVLNERVMTDVDGQLFIPDRLIIDGDEVIILDYKTGEKKESHKQQLLKYQRVLQNMNFNITKKVLVYLGDEIYVEEF